ncbi:MAG TPA: L-ribulose-5-phosphate 4-epimerase [Sedimentisphaerales bacterium]|nr:L-ribulose-5-phosphate 4-epimerase [Sedimentisphaerales bacterium]HRS13275.1 L-ribulose-5-phosphate 4-epimerase [Sedimentisphaerales bacterium]HRV49889.1 L-ribulose-5-phosphate 4-epimerase [Sedimentisphaerales bacterium]
MHEKLKQQVWQANLDLQRYGLVVFTWGNVSGIDRDAGIVAIKPSGVSYDELVPEQIVLLDLRGNVVEGDLRPSSDTPTHLELYRSFRGVGGICHTHSPHATMWAQARRDIPCFGTTHADHFYGAVPVTDTMSAAEIRDNYEANTGLVIVRRFRDIDPMQMPAVLVANHGPFTWGKDAAEAVKNAVVLEEVAKMASGTLAIYPKQQPISQDLLDKHYLRKHGKNAYYGQA